MSKETTPPFVKHNNLHTRASAALVGVLTAAGLFGGAFAQAASEERAASTSVTCDAFDVEFQGNDTAVATVSWTQKDGAQADLMRLAYYDGQALQPYPISGVTHAAQTLTFHPGYLGGFIKPMLTAEIIDTNGAAAACPAFPVTAQ